MKHLTLIASLFFLFLFSAQAYERSSDQALELSRYFLGDYKNARQETIMPYYYQGDVQFWIINFEGGGFVLVSARDKVRPILAFSLTNSFPFPKSKELVSHFNGLAHKIQYIQNSQESVSMNQDEFQWKTLHESFSSEVGPLLLTRWGQLGIYAYYTPTQNGVHTNAGCVATAMGQVLKYHRWPLRGRGQHSYSQGNQSIYVNFSEHVYQWDQMPDSPVEQDQAYEIAKLLFHTGVSVNTLYSTQSSDAYVHVAGQAFVKYFRYHQKSMSVAWRANVRDSLWVRTIINELNQKRVVIYAGRGKDDQGKDYGHAFVVDGYKDDYFHINWGWTGAYNGHYLLNKFTSAGINWNSDELLVYGIIPDKNQ